MASSLSPVPNTESQSSSLDNPTKVTMVIEDFSKQTDKHFSRRQCFTLSGSSSFSFILNCRPYMPSKFFRANYSMMYLSLVPLQERPKVSVRYQMSILNALGDKCETQEGNAHFSFCSNDRFDALYLIKHDYLLNAANGLLVNDKLTVYCEVEEIKPKAENVACSSLQTNLHKVSEHYEALLANGKLYDVVLVAGGKDLCVHKVILAARSPVFAAMFAYDTTKEARENRVEITDVDFEVVEELLRYIYTGKVSLDRFAAELLMAADKYQMDCLKTMCEHYLCTVISIETVSNLYQLSDMYQASGLNIKCIEYITEHGLEVMATEGWKLIVTKPDLMQKLFHKFSSKFCDFIKKQ